MIRFKMLGKDINSNPTQYRTWIVNNTPDLTGALYTGPKSGNNPLVDVVAYIITDDTVVADFNLPQPEHWFPGTSNETFSIRKVLPAPSEGSRIAIVGDGYAYMFGGKITNAIYRATINNPADWADTGARLPLPLYGSSLGIVDGYIYLFGGDDGYYDGYKFSDGYAGAIGNIFRAAITNPLSWINTGASLPVKLFNSSYGAYDGYLYLFGGLVNGLPTNHIYRAPRATPLVWADLGANLPIPIYGNGFAQLDGYWMIMGGMTSAKTPTNTVWRASVLSPTSWILDGYLPYTMAYSEFFTVGNFAYMIGSVVGAASTGYTPILRSPIVNPMKWSDTDQVVPGVISSSQVAIINDRVWLFGGSGQLAIFACNQEIKYSFQDPLAITYGSLTRTLFHATDNIGRPFQAIGFPYWKTNYKL